ncbi:MAG: fumarylacetoacetate hydrolase family protein, partial [Armatimonadetes bacterium]|nr:fumarylacetoacetate hydrolase family protein [Armatimonadota bacterium]
MKLLTYGDKEEERLAAVAGDERYLIDLNIASHGTIPPDTVAFLKGDYWETAQKVLTLPPEEIRHALIERDGVRIGAPVPRPPTLIALGLNYKDHAEEGHQPLPETPLLFAKAPACVIGPYDPIPYPPEVQQLDYEVELGIVIGRKARKVSES